MVEEIYALSRIQAKPECVDKVRIAYDRPLSDVMRDAGCTSYSCYQDLNDPNAFLAVGRWVSRASFNEHLAVNRHNLEIANKDLIQPPELTILQVQTGTQPR